MEETIGAVADLRRQGVPVVGYTWFPLLTMVDWKYRQGRRPLNHYLLHLGLYDSTFDDQGTLCRQSTPLVARYQKYIAEPMPAIDAPALAAVYSEALLEPA
jgi:hypothetical protein